ncbi:hemerythrin domain-containing protein [Hydrogenophaga soli]|nr:hemerythrin domain-containing protein [Burkholderiaceae bacterium]
MNNITHSAADQTPLNDFSNCHAGILSKLSVLHELPAWVEAAAKARVAAQEMLGFFELVMYEHHEEEERALFPAVEAAAAAGDERARMVELAQTLTHEHRELEALWQQVQPALKRVAKGQEVELPAEALAQLVSRYQAHARGEESSYLPLAHAILSREGAHMDALGLALHIRHRPPVVGYV